MLLSFEKSPRLGIKILMVYVITLGLLVEMQRLAKLHFLCKLHHCVGVKEVHGERQRDMYSPSQ